MNIHTELQRHRALMQASGLMTPPSQAGSGAAESQAAPVIIQALDAFTDRVIAFTEAYLCPVESNEPSCGDAETAMEYAAGLGRESGRP